MPEKLYTLEKNLETKRWVLRNVSRYGGGRDVRMLQLDDHDRVLVEGVRKAMDKALRQAHSRTAVAKRLAVLAVRERNIQEAYREFGSIWWEAEAA